MKYLKRFNEANMSNVFSKFDIKKGSVIVANQTIQPDKLDFRKTAKTKLGEFISMKNISNKDYDNVPIEKGTVLFIFTDTPKMDGEYVSIEGYGGFLGNSIINTDKYNINEQAYVRTFPYDSLATQQLILVLEQGLADVIDYVDLPSRKRIEFESYVRITKFHKINNKLSKFDHVILTQKTSGLKLEVEDIEIKWNRGDRERFVTIHGVEIDNPNIKLKNKEVEIKLSYEEFVKVDLTYNDKKITSDPFEDVPYREDFFK